MNTDKPTSWEDEFRHYLINHEEWSIPISIQEEMITRIKLLLKEQRGNDCRDIMKTIGEAISTISGNYDKRNVETRALAMWELLKEHEISQMMLLRAKIRIILNHE